MSADINVQSIKQCQIELCKSMAVSQCFHCSKNICLEHLTEHVNLINVPQISLIDQLNYLKDQSEHMTIEQLSKQALNKLEQWKNESYEIINQLFDIKYQELEMGIQKQEDYLNENRIKQQQLVKDVQNKLNESNLTNEQINNIKQNIEQIKNNLNEFNNNFIKIETKSLNIDHNYIKIQIKSRELNLKQLETIQPIKTCHLKWHAFAMASNQYFILLQYNEQILNVYDHELNLYKQIPWNHDIIWDMCWSTIINEFILLTLTNIYTIDVKTTNIKLIDQIKPHKTDAPFGHCTCSHLNDNDTHLFISYKGYDPVIEEYNLKLTFQLQKQWKSPQTCSHDERINCLRYNNYNDQIGLIIYNKTTDQWHLDVHELLTFNVIWSLELGEICLQHGYYLNPLSNNEWLIINTDSHLLYNVRSNDHLYTTIKYDKRLLNAIMFNENYLVISTMEYTINLHELYVKK
ncbi:unnamed protein product [Didymodactylos carnosus]|uniref:B box-type domain-containing protein n=1 Tax=Didymodactylos carnosus TaxID=1234261 RepID=A0A815QFX9_9BILA|nr:unnamed protein product [Didymodactylos carnosus]CAF4332549.1 unnamed protein product [Didymodactylos carnosus]